MQKEEKETKHYTLDTSEHCNSKLQQSLFAMAQKIEFSFKCSNWNYPSLCLRKFQKWGEHCNLTPPVSRPHMVSSGGLAQCY